jgi:hypothetical protein
MWALIPPSYVSGITLRCAHGRATQRAPFKSSLVVDADRLRPTRPSRLRHTCQHREQHPYRDRLTASSAAASAHDSGFTDITPHSPQPDTPTLARTSMRSTSKAYVIGVVFVFIAACAAPMTQLGNVSEDVVRAEQLKQHQLVLRTDFEYQQRLDDVAYPLLKAAVPLCSKAVGPMSGIRFANVHSFKKEYRAAARGLGFTDTLAIVGVTKGSAAERAGVKAGDRILSVGGDVAPAGPTATADFVKRLSKRTTAKAKAAETLPSEPLRLTMRRGTDGESGIGASSEIALEVPSDTVCLQCCRDQG